MTDKNPFSEGEDSERTIIRPSPGGRRPVPVAQPPARAFPPAPPPSAAPPPAAPSAALADAPPPPPPPPPPQTVARPQPPRPARPPTAPAQPPMAAASGEPAELPGFGDTPLVDAAAPLLQLLARLRNTASAPDAGDLRERVVQEVQAFDARARAAGVPPELLRSASYALCASIDDVAINTPWGNAGGWAQRTLLAAFHPDLAGKERFFDVLMKVRSNPEKFEPLIELMYLCLSLGYMGSYRGNPRGTAEIEKIRAETYDVIQAKRGAFSPALSPSPSGVAAPYRPKKARLPVWVAAAAGLAALGGLFFWVSTDLATNSDGVTERMLDGAPAAMPQIARAAPVQPPPPPPPPDQPTLLDKLRAALKPDIDQGFVAVVGTESTPVVRVRNRNMFPGGSAKLQPAFVPVLEHVGAALAHEPGQVVVAGYTDNQPIHTVQFPSNFQLSAARATAAKDVLARSIGEAARVTSEGRADADPIAPNSTAEGREQNRRIEIILRRES